MRKQILGSCVTLLRCSGGCAKVRSGTRFWSASSQLNAALRLFDPLAAPVGCPAHGDSPLGYRVPPPINWSVPNGAGLLLNEIGRFTGRIAMQYSLAIMISV